MAAIRRKLEDWERTFIAAAVVAVLSWGAALAVWVYRGAL